MSASNVVGQGRTALVTGASRGIGPLIAAQIAGQGGHVVLTGRSAGTKDTSAPSAASSAVTAFRSAADRPVSTTWPPWRAICAAISGPMPREAPVTRAVRP